MTNSLTTAAQNASTYSEPIKKDCKFCGKEGLLILPVRCATLPKEAKAPPLPANVGAHAKSILIAQSSYTLRTARVGYLYVLVNRKGALTWQCYISTAAGYWSQFAADAPPLAPPEFSCRPDTHGINASMVSILQAEDVQTAYLLFTPSPLTEAMLSEKALKNIAKADALCAKGQMVKFSPAKWVKGNYKQDDCLDAAGVAKSVSEFAIYNDPRPIENPLTRAMANSVFPIMDDGLGSDGANVTMARAVGHLLRLDPLKDFMTNKRAVAVAVYDHIGVVQELNDFRNDAINKIHAFLATKDPESVTNRWKFDALHAIREVKAGFESGVANDTQKYYNESAMDLRARAEPRFADDSTEMKNHKARYSKFKEFPGGRDAWARTFPKQAAGLDEDLKKHEKYLSRWMEDAKADAKKKWASKYASLLDPKAMTRFDTDFDAATKAATDLSANRVADHLAWVVHERLVDAFEFYDRKNVRSGLHFEGQSALCTLGMVGSKKSAVQVDAWLAMPLTDRKNIYMRGLLLNQDDIIADAATALAAAGAIADAAPTVAMIPGDKMFLALKNLVKFFAAADKAWDEYVRESEKPGNARNKGLEKTREGAKLFKMSEMNRTLFRKGITGFEKRAVGFFGGLVFSRMGALAEELKFDQLMYGIDPEKPHIDPKTKAPYPRGTEPVRSSANPSAAVQVSAEEAAKAARQEAQAAARKMMTVAQYRDLQRKVGITFTAEEYLSRKSHMTSNYHQVRIGGLLGVMETMALGAKLKHIYDNGGGTGIEYAEATASLFAISSIACDMGYGLAKSARETTTNAAVRGAGDIVRGGWKLAAGALGALAGGIGVAVDFARLESEQEGKGRVVEMTIIWFRIGIGFLNTGMGAAAAFSYSGPLFRRLASKMANDAVTRRATMALAAKGAEWLAARVMLLRLVAWGTGAGLVLTVGEIGYHIYMYYQPNALEVWMKRSAFRNRSLGGNRFYSLDAEIEELSNARKMVGV